MISIGSITAILAALLALAPPLVSAQTATTAAGKPLLLAQLTPPPLPQPPSAQYFYADNGKPVGPLWLAEIRAKIASGAIKPDTLVWKAGLPSWVAAKELTEIAPIFARPARAPVASDCTGKVLLSDDFKQVDDSWGTDANTDKVTVEQGKLKVKPDADGDLGLTYKGRLFVDADYCVTVQTPDKVKDLKDRNLLAGLLFWADDIDNAYALLVAPQGRAAIGHAVKGKWTNPAGFREFDAVKKGPGAKNMLRVITSASSIIVYVNGQKFASVRAQAPMGGGMVGFWAQSEKGNRDTWKFFDLKVTEHAP